MMPVMTSAGSRWRASGVKAFRYATALATVPGQTAAVFVAFAAMGTIPVKISAGKVMKLPPPATELMAPARTAAKKRKTGWPMCTRKDTRSLRILAGRRAFRYSRMKLLGSFK